MTSLYLYGRQMAKMKLRDLDLGRIKKEAFGET